MSFLRIIPIKFLIVGIVVVLLGWAAYQTFIGDKAASSADIVASAAPAPSIGDYPSPSPAASVASVVPKATPKPSVKASPSASVAVSPSPAASTSSSSSSSSNSNSSSVVLNGIDPSSPAFGNSMTIKGSGFGSSQGVYNVYYNGQIEPYGGIQSWSDTEIKTTSPFFASNADYQLEVQTSDGRKSNRITIRSGDGQPIIDSFSPSNAKPGEALVLKGSRFGSQGQVNFYQNYPSLSGSGQIISWSDTEIHLTLPSSLTSGTQYGVEVVSGGGGKSSFQYYTLGG